MLSQRVEQHRRRRRVRAPSEALRLGAPRLLHVEPRRAQLHKMHMLRAVLAASLNVLSIDANFRLGANPAAALTRDLDPASRRAAASWPRAIRDAR